MNTTKRNAINLILIPAILFLMLLFASSFSFAVSVPNASGLVNSVEGVNLRQSATTDSKIVDSLADNTKVTIYKEVFKKKSNTSAKYVWYYVKANGKKGYIRSDLVDHLKYGSVKGTITKKVNSRKGPGIKMKVTGSYEKGKKVTICLVANPVSSAKGPCKTWYKVKSGSGYRYVCSKYVKLTEKSNSNTVKTSSSITSKEFESYLTSQGFPESYKVKLRKLHKAHPNWKFVGYKTGIKWSAALAAETKKGVSLVSKSEPKSYRNGSTQPESGWYYANSKAVAYYMDPRNFLNENSIYMFEDLSYRPANQTEGVVSKILKDCKLPKYGFTAKLFVKAGAKSKASPVFLAARARQETGSGGRAINGSSKLGKVYNPFNIGAYGGTDPVYNGLVYAKAAGWNTPEKALNGGAAMLSKYYINRGQYTTYYQRFNARNGASKIGTHQYMTNIKAPYSEAVSTRSSYASYGITNHSLVFEIPIYNSMPASTKLP